MLINYSNGSGSSLPSALKNHDGLAVLIGGCGIHLVAVQFQLDRRLGLGWGGKMQRGPIHRDLAAADAEEAAEVDDGGAHLAAAVHQHVDDAAHILVGGAAHFTAENALDLVVGKDGDARAAPAARSWPGPGGTGAFQTTPR